MGGTGGAINLNSGISQKRVSRPDWEREYKAPGITFQKYEDKYTKVRKKKEPEKTPGEDDDGAKTKTKDDDSSGVRKSSSVSGGGGFDGPPPPNSGPVAVRPDGWQRSRKWTDHSQTSIGPSRFPVLWEPGQEGPLKWKAERYTPPARAIGGGGRGAGPRPALGEGVMPAALPAGPTARNAALGEAPPRSPLGAAPTRSPLGGAPVRSPLGMAEPRASLGGPARRTPLDESPPRTPLGSTPPRAGIGRGLYEESPGVDMGGHTQVGEADGNALFVPTNRSGGAREHGWEGSPSERSGPTTIQGQAWERGKEPKVGPAPVRKAIKADPGIQSMPVWDRPDWIRPGGGLAPTRRNISEDKTSEIDTRAVNDRVRQRRGFTTDEGSQQQHFNVASGLRQEMLAIGTKHDAQDVEHMQNLLDSPVRTPKTGRMRAT
jgi:hypothetical protein